MVRETAEAVLRQHDITDWKIVLTNNKVQLGAVRYSTKTMFLANRLSEVTEDELKEVVLHEIAHILTPKHNHDKVWKARAKELGCSGKRTVSFGRMPDFKYLVTCESCDFVTFRHRKLKGATHNDCGGKIIYNEIERR